MKMLHLITADVQAVALLQIELHDGKRGRITDHGLTKSRRNTVNAGKSQFATGVHVQVGMRTADFAGSNIGPTDQTHALVEKQVALCVATTHHQLHIHIDTFRIEGAQRSVTEDVDIVNQDRRIALCEQRNGSAEAAAGIQQGFALIGDMNRHRPLMFGQIVDDLLPEMMDIDHQFFGANFDQPVDGVPQQGLTVYRDQRLGHTIGEGTQTSAETGGKNQSSHKREGKKRYGNRGKGAEPSQSTTSAGGLYENNNRDAGHANPMF